MKIYFEVIGPLPLRFIFLEIVRIYWLSGENTHLSNKSISINK